MAVKVLTKTLSGSGANQLVATHIAARWVKIYNATGNGALSVGDKNITATNYGFQIAAAASDTIASTSGELQINLEDIWFIGTDTNIIRVLYVT